MLINRGGGREITLIDPVSLTSNKMDDQDLSCNIHLPNLVMIRSVVFVLRVPTYIHTYTYTQTHRATKRNTRRIHRHEQQKIDLKEGKLWSRRQSDGLTRSKHHHLHHSLSLKLYLLILHGRRHGIDVGVAHTMALSLQSTSRMSRRLL